MRLNQKTVNNGKFPKFCKFTLIKGTLPKWSYIMLFYVLIKISPTFMKQKLSEVEGEIDRNTNGRADFSAEINSIWKSSRFVTQANGRIEFLNTVHDFDYKCVPLYIELGMEIWKTLKHVFHCSVTYIKKSIYTCTTQCIFTNWEQFV